VTIAARDAYHFLGSPEGELALAEATLYLATAPKSNARTSRGAQRGPDARDAPGARAAAHPQRPHRAHEGDRLRRGYRYDPAEKDGVADQEYLPDALRGEVYYRPGRFGAEKAIAERLAWWAERRRGAGGGGSGEAPGAGRAATTRPGTRAGAGGRADATETRAAVPVLAARAREYRSGQRPEVAGSPRN
jgi:hypothetical protein